MWNEVNPSSLYLGTTWELIAADKYIRSGAVALQMGGTNSVTITQANLPNVKLKVDTFSLSTSKHRHYPRGNAGGTVAALGIESNTFLGMAPDRATSYVTHGNHQGYPLSEGGGESTGSASPNTSALGSGTALSIQPAYITLKFWKRLS